MMRALDIPRATLPFHPPTDPDTPDWLKRAAILLVTGHMEVLDAMNWIENGHEPDTQFAG